MIQEVKKAKLSNKELFVKEAQVKETETVDNKPVLNDEQLFAIAQDDSALENIINEIRNDSSKSYDSNYRKIFNYVIENNMKEFAELKDLIQKEKDNIYKRVKENNSFSANISNKSIISNYYKDVFGRKSKTISFEDYAMLLEMKRVLEIDEQITLAEVEEV